jgi:hypothetical protein
MEHLLLETDEKIVLDERQKAQLEERSVRNMLCYFSVFLGRYD